MLANLHLDCGYASNPPPQAAGGTFTFQLAERLSGTGVSANALHPASLMDTKMVHEAFGYTMSTVEEGAEATVRLTTSPELEGVTGHYFDGQRESRTHRQARDADDRERLWTLSEDLCGRFLEPLRAASN